MGLLIIWLYKRSGYCRHERAKNCCFWEHLQYHTNFLNDFHDSFNRNYLFGSFHAICHFININYRTIFSCCSFCIFKELLSMFCSEFFSCLSPKEQFLEIYFCFWSLKLWKMICLLGWLVIWIVLVRISIVLVCISFVFVCTSDMYTYC